MGHNPDNFDQLDFRGFDDDAGLGSATAKAAANTNWTQDTDENFRVRFTIDGSVTNDFGFGVQLHLQYNRNSGGWNDVGAASSVVQASASPNVADGAATGTDANPLSDNIYTGAKADSAYIACDFDEGDGVTGVTSDLDDNEWTEAEFCVQIVGNDVADADTIELRVRYGAGSAERAGETLNAYTNTPSITANKPANVTMVADTGSYALTGSAELFDISLLCNTGAYTKTGQAQEYDFSQLMNTGAYVYTGVQADFIFFQPSTKIPVWIPYLELIYDGVYRPVYRTRYRRVLLTELGGGGAPVNFTMVADAGSYVYTGQALLTALNTILNTGSYNYTGVAANLLRHYVTLMENGSYAVTGNDVLFGLSLLANTGAYAKTGQQILPDIISPFDSGSYAYTGVVADLIKSFKIVAEPGAYNLTGQAILPDIVSPFDTGSYALSGIAADLLRGFIMQADTGSYALTGQNAIFAISLLNNTGVYNITGQNADALISTVMETGSYIITGQEINAIISLLHASGSYNITGEEADLIYNPLVNRVDFPRALFKHAQRRSFQLRR